MGFKCGIVGLPNVGKSTLFNALTKANVSAANFPFCTIEPNIGTVSVPDTRLNNLNKIVKTRRIIPTTIQFIDIAGLVKGASKGEGLGNQFLTNIRETEAIAHVVRCFDNKEIIHLTGTLNPSADINIINAEMVLSDFDTCERIISRMKKKNKFNKDINFKLIVLEKCLSHLGKLYLLRTLKLDFNEKESIRDINFLTLKPTMYIANVDSEDLEYLKNNQYLEQVRIIAENENSVVIPVCALIESELSILEKEKEYKQFIDELGLKECSLNKMICAGYTLLNLQTYFTVGIKEIRAWTISIGTTALEAARKIHTDFGKGFIRAQIISYKDYINYNGERGAKEAGKIRFEGKNYIIKDGDIINFLFNV